MSPKPNSSLSDPAEQLHHTTPRCLSAWRFLRLARRHSTRLFLPLSIASGCTPGRPAQPPAANGGRDSGVAVEDETHGPKPIEAVVTEVPSPYFVKEGKPFCFVGANNYYLMYKSRAAVLDVLDAAQAMNAKVLRIWAFLDRGSLDGTVPNIKEPGHQEGVYFQYWDTLARAPAYNDGPDGLERLDFVLSEAKKRGLMLTLVFTNNWRDFGGMDQYLVWYGLEDHDAFYRDLRVRAAYRAYVEHIVNRVNSIDGVPYKEDPTIFSWQLANEPRTLNYQEFDRAEGWNVDTILDWAREMSSFLKSLDANHMVAVGDEGFLKTDEPLEGSKKDWPYHAPFGVDHERLSGLPTIDYGTYHLYPDHWGTSLEWGHAWIRAHIETGRRIGKPEVLEEYGLPVQRRHNTTGPVVGLSDRRQVTYSNWNRLVLHEGGQAALFWMLSGIEQPGVLYPDYDHFAVYRGDASYQLLRGYAERMPSQAAACRLAPTEQGDPSSAFVHAQKHRSQ